MSSTPHILVIGAGLCGTLLALRMAQRGYRVSLHERRPDMRLGQAAAGRSINLALSHRGLLALERAGLRQKMEEVCVPMYGRQIHPLGGQEFLSRYSGRSSDYINSVSRGGLNIALLDAAEAYPNIEIHFNSQCTGVELESGQARFVHTENGQTTTAAADLVVGTDGAGSAVRQSMMARSGELRFSFSQQFLGHGYKELTIPPAPDGGFRIAANALHIWPRGGFMVIALPNLDGSFTVTMFHPFDGEPGFNQLRTPGEVADLFRQHYPDLLPLLPDLAEDFFQNPTGALATVRCSPWQAFGKCVLMGDAAHAVVPFYGQGMNASFEDVRVFDELLDEYGTDWAKLLPAFEESRLPNANAIADLALDNFTEMQDRVDDPDFMQKRKLEMQLEQSFPDYYSKYSLVTFRPDLPYREAMELGRRQDDILLKLCAGGHAPAIGLEEVYRLVKG